MPVRESLIGTFSALQKWRAAHVNALPAGWVGYATAESNTTGVTTETDVTGLSVTVELPANRLIQVRAYCPRISSTVAGDLANFRIKEGSTQLQEARIDVGQSAGSSNGGTAGVVETEPFVPDAGSHTYKCTGSLAQGSGELAFRASATGKSWITVVDLGAAPS